MKNRVTRPRAPHARIGRGLTLLILHVPLRVLSLSSRRRRRQNELHPRVRTTVTRFRLDVDIDIDIERLIRFQIERRGSLRATTATAAATVVVHLLLFPVASCTILGSDSICICI
jgi:hypothetical protein